MRKLIIFRCVFFALFLQKDKYKLIRRNVCTVVVIKNISRILFQEKAQNVKKSSLVMIHYYYFNLNYFQTQFTLNLMKFTNHLLKLTKI